MKGKYNLAFGKAFSLQERFESDRSRIEHVETNFLIKKKYMVINSITSMFNSNFRTTLLERLQRKKKLEQAVKQGRQPVLDDL